MREDDEQTVARPQAAAAAERTQLRDAEQLARAPGTRLRGTEPLEQPESTEVRSSERTPEPESTEVRSIERSSREASSQGAHETPSAQFAPGDAIKNRFVLQAPIGRGGMGIVFAALDLRKQEARDPDPHVAIKILNANFRDHPHALVALQRESRKAQTLAHPNVVTVFDFDRDGDVVYMTMELLQGRSLDAIVREARGKGVGRAAAAPIIRGIAEGLVYAHRKGIVHSDLKPGNVFVTSDGAPKILDFGIARAAPNSAAADKDTFDAGVLGAYTEAYATDEMMRGAEPHASDDLYALGLIAYELLSGFHPYQRHGAVRARELGLRPEPLKGVKRREWKAIERCLAFERHRRPRDAAEFLRLFAGISTLQKSLVAAVATLAVAAAGLAYRNYQQAGPAIAFSDLPAETQREFNAHMAEGDQEWRFYERDHNLLALVSAVERYADAYDLHPRNRRAMRALEGAADALLIETKDKPEARRQGARTLSEMSQHLAKYAPLMDAADAP